MKVTNLIIICIIISGCASNQPSIVYYDGTIVQGNNYGTINGSLQEMSFPYDDKTTYVLAVNGAPVKGGKSAYLNKLKLALGTNRITLAFSQGSIVGQHTYKIALDSGSSLVAKAESDQKTIVFWVEDFESKTEVTERVVVQGTTNATTPIFIPIMY